MKRRTCRATTLMEMLVLCLIMVIIGGAILKLLTVGYDAQYLISSRNAAQAAARQGVDTVVDGVRGAASLSAASPSTLTWVDNAGNTTRYWVSSGAIRKSINGDSTGVILVVNNIQSISFGYGTWNGSSWSYTSSPTTPGTVGAVVVTVTASLHDQARTVTGSTRIREQRCTLSGTSNIF